MNKLYKVAFEVNIVANDELEAEEKAKDIALTIQDDSVRPTSVIEILNDKIVAGAMKITNNLFKNGTNSDGIMKILRDIYLHFYSEEIINVLYTHCEFIYLHKEDGE